MDKQKALYYIDNSFLTSLLKDNDVTDISYNGQDIYYVSNTQGRKKSKIRIEGQLAKDFIRQVANIAEKQFSYSSPILDISVGRYRINATHQSIARIQDDGVVTFSIRLASNNIKINDKSDFFTPEIVELIKVLLTAHQSIVIGGVTSSGKTELQKYLLFNLKEAERVIVIDNVLELDQVRNENIDLTCWQVSDDVPQASSGNLIRNALRNNPDWLIVAESRGAEMVDALNSAMTGLPLITTLHSLDAMSMPHRMARMMMKSEQKIDYQEALNDIYYHFHYYFYLTKEEIKGKIKRRISQIYFGDSKGKLYPLYLYDGEHHYYPLPEEGYNAIKKYINDEQLSVFRKEK